MAYHFSANQYEDKYSPRKLGNWECPKWYPERPRQRYKSTKIIADDRGRLLDGIDRENAWGNYVGTWDLPRRITRDYVKKLVAPPERLVKLWKSPNDDAKEANKRGLSEREKDKAPETTCTNCEGPANDCTCERASKIKSSGSMVEDSGVEEEKCGEPLTCTKCDNDVCLCEEKCRCNAI